MMTVVILETGESAELEDSYARRLIEQGKAIYASGGTPDRPPQSETVDLEELAGMIARAKTVLSIATKSGEYNPAVLSAIAASGHADRIYDIGDEILIPWTDNSGNTPVTYQYPFIVADIRDCRDENNAVHKNAIWLMAANCTPVGMKIPFDAAETNYAKGCFIWSQSAARQWLNSDAAKNTGWWSSQHEGDAAPDSAYTSLPGWMNGFSADWKAIFKPVQVTTATGEEAGSPEETTYDTFFLPSVSQLYGDPKTAVFAYTAPFTESDTAWEYIKKNSTSEVPTCDGDYLPLNSIFGRLNTSVSDSSAKNPVLLRSCTYAFPQIRFYFTMNFTNRASKGSGPIVKWPFGVEESVVNKAFQMNPCCVLY